MVKTPRLPRFLVFIVDVVYLCQEKIQVSKLAKKIKTPGAQVSQPSFIHLKGSRFSVWAPQSATDRK